MGCIERDGKARVRCDRDGWSGQMSSLKYEQYLFRHARRTSRSLSIIGIVSIVIMVVIGVSIPQMYHAVSRVFLKISSEEDNWILTVDRMKNADQISIANIAMKIVTSENLTVLPLTALLNTSDQKYDPGIIFVNCFPLDYLNMSESFMLDKATYSTGDRFVLMGFDGVPVFCNYELKAY